MKTFVAALALVFFGADVAGVTPTVDTTVNRDSRGEQPELAVAENSANGTVVGTVPLAQSKPGETFTFSLVGGNERNTFDLNDRTGEIRVANSSTLDFEHTRRFELTVRVTRTAAQTDRLRQSFVEHLRKSGITANAAERISGYETLNVGINVQDVNESPSLKRQSFQVAEDADDAHVVGTVIATDADADDALRYEVVSGDTNSAFSIDSHTGELRVQDRRQLNFETTSRFEMTVRVTDSHGVTASSGVTVSVDDANERPVLEPQSFSLPADVAAGTIVGRLAASDPDRGDSLTFSLVDGELTDTFDVDPKTGELVVTDVSRLARNSDSPLRLGVQVTDKSGASSRDVATVTLEPSAAVTVSPPAKKSTAVETANSAEPATAAEDATAQQSEEVVETSATGAAGESQAAVPVVAESTAPDFGVIVAFALTCSVAFGLFVVWLRQREVLKMYRRENDVLRERLEELQAETGEPQARGEELDVVRHEVEQVRHELEKNREGLELERQAMALRQEAIHIKEQELASVRSQLDEEHERLLREVDELRAETARAISRPSRFDESGATGHNNSDEDVFVYDDGPSGATESETDTASGEFGGESIAFRGGSPGAFHAPQVMPSAWDASGSVAQIAPLSPQPADPFVSAKPAWTPETTELRNSLAEMFGIPIAVEGHLESERESPAPVAQQAPTQLPSFERAGKFSTLLQTEETALVQPRTDQPQQKTTPASSDPDSVAAYMDRLLSQLRGGGEHYPSPVAAPSPANRSTQTAGSGTTATAHIVDRNSGFAALLDKAEDVGVAEPFQQPIAHSAGPCQPIDKDELRANMDSFRKVANRSARSAIGSHMKKRRRKELLVSGSVGLLASGVSVALFTSRFWSPSIPLGFGWTAAGGAGASLLYMLWITYRRRGPDGDDEPDAMTEPNAESTDD